MEPLHYPFYKEQFDKLNKTSTPSAPNFLGLVIPKDLIIMILKKLPARDLIETAKVCRTFRIISIEILKHLLEENATIFFKILESSSLQIVKVNFNKNYWGERPPEPDEIKDHKRKLWNAGLKDPRTPPLPAPPPPKEKSFLELNPLSDFTKNMPKATLLAGGGSPPLDPDLFTPKEEFKFSFLFKNVGEINPLTYTQNLSLFIRSHHFKQNLSFQTIYHDLFNSLISFLVSLSNRIPS